MVQVVGRKSNCLSNSNQACDVPIPSDTVSIHPFLSLKIRPRNNPIEGRGRSAETGTQRFALVRGRGGVA